MPAGVEHDHRLDVDPCERDDADVRLDGINPNGSATTAAQLRVATSITVLGS